MEIIIRFSISRYQKEYISLKYGIKVNYMYIQIPEAYKNYTGKVKVIEIIPIPGAIGIGLTLFSTYQK